MVSLKSLLGGGVGELGQPDLLREVVDGILKLRRHGDRGIEMLPHEVEVRITVGEGSVQVVQRFVEDAAFDRDVGRFRAQPPGQEPRGPHAHPALQRERGPADASRGRGGRAPRLQPPHRGRRSERHDLHHTRRAQGGPARPGPLARGRAAGGERRGALREREGGEPPRSAAPSQRLLLRAGGSRPARGRGRGPSPTGRSGVPPCRRAAACSCAPAT